MKHFAKGPEVALNQTALEVRNHRCHLLQRVECLTDVGPLLAKHTRRVPGDPSEKDQQMLFEVQPLLVVEKDRFDVNGSVRIEAEHVEPSECSSVLVLFADRLAQDLDLESACRLRGFARADVLPEICIETLQERHRETRRRSDTGFRRKRGE